MSILEERLPYLDALQLSAGSHEAPSNTPDENDTGEKAMMNVKTGGASTKLVLQGKVKHKSLLKMMAATMRALKRVKQVEGPLSTPCLIWQGSKTHNGYASFAFGRVHRVAYELMVGPLTPGMDLHHECRNRACVNWEHLVELTPKQHAKFNTGRAGRGSMTHCSKGHEFTERNTKVRPNGTRECRKCWTERKREAKQRAKTAPFAELTVI